MPTTQIFDNAYPFVFTENKESNLELDEIKIPAQNVIARLNDQWIEEIGLDLNKFGYGNTLKGLLNSKIGEKPKKQNLLEKIKILQTIGLVFPKLSDNAKEEAMNFIEQEMILYPNLKGSRDQTYFHHKKQLTVVLLELLSNAKGTKYEKSILDLLYDILEDNFAVVSRKTYFDEYNSYTYSEEQRSIANTVVTGIEKKLVNLLDNISHNLKLDILRRLWTFPLLQKNNELKKTLVNKIHIGNGKKTLSFIKELIKKLEKESAPELDILKEMIIEDDILHEKDLNPEEALRFYNKNLSSNEENANPRKIIENIKKLFKNAKSKEEKIEVIKCLITPKTRIENILDDEPIKKEPNILAMTNLFLDDSLSRNIIIDILVENHDNKKLYERIHDQLNKNLHILEPFQKRLTETLVNLLTDENSDNLKDNFSNFVVQSNQHELLHEKKGKGLIDLLLEKRKNCTVSDSILENIFQKGQDTSLGRYLQYIIFTQNK